MRKKQRREEREEREQKRMVRKTKIEMERNEKTNNGRSHSAIVRKVFRIPNCKQLLQERKRTLNFLSFRGTIPPIDF
jgi:hypothetical protein